MISQSIKDACLLEGKNYLLVKHHDRVKQLGEVFTPTELVLDVLSNLPFQSWEIGKTYLDPTCGNGQFLAAVLLIKINLGHTNPLDTIYGVDLMQDNVDECRRRLINIVGDTPSNWKIVINNIRCENGLTYDYSFDNIPTDEEKLAISLKKQKQIQKEKKKQKQIQKEKKKQERESIINVSRSNLFG